MLAAARQPCTRSPAPDGSTLAPDRCAGPTAHDAPLRRAMTDELATTKRVHLVGVGGSGMSTLGQLLLLMGKQVSGSDLSSSAATRSLADAGADIHLGHAAEYVGDATLVVRSAAVPTDNPEVAEARRRGIPSLTHAEALGELTRGRSTAAVAGTHGKTTTTALIAWLLDRAGLEPTTLIGGVALN